MPIKILHSLGMAFNHYARLKKILEDENHWFIKRIDQATRVKNFKGETVEYPHYYRLHNHLGQPIKWGKFQQLERLASALDIPAEELPIIQD